jgi:putative transposase
VSIFRERNMPVAEERSIAALIGIHGRHPVSADGVTWYSPRDRRFLKPKHHIHSALENSLIVRTIQYIEDRTECFDDYVPCRLKNHKLKHVKRWLQFFQIS